MADYFAAMAAEIQSEGGTIEKFVGDAIMAVFGVPTVHEDDAVRAVRAARRMLERLRSWNESADPAEALEIRIGLSTGDVLASGAQETTSTSRATPSTSQRASSRPRSRGRSSSPIALRVPYARTSSSARSTSRSR